MVEHTRRELLLAFGGLLSSARLASVYAQDFASYTDSDREALLLGGMVVSVKDIGEGVTKPIRAELSWKGVRHSAQIQRVDRALPDFFGQDGAVLPMRDAWRFNIAAYRLDRLLQLSMVPVSVSRSYISCAAALAGARPQGRVCWLPTRWAGAQLANGWMPSRRPPTDSNWPAWMSNSDERVMSSARHSPVAGRHCDSCHCGVTNS